MQLDWLEFNHLGICCPVYLAVNWGFPVLLPFDILGYFRLDLIEYVCLDCLLAF